MDRSERGGQTHNVSGTGNTFISNRRDINLAQVSAGSAFLIACCGFAVAMWVHLETLLGVDPQSRFPHFWIFQLVLFGLLIPMIVEMFVKRDPFRILRSPKWARNILYALFVYYAVHFYVFIYWSVENLNSRVTWRMFSSGWLLLFATAMVYYSVRFADHRRLRVGNQTGATSA